MSKFQIEKVMHSIISIFSECAVISYYPKSDTILQVNFCEEKTSIDYKNNDCVGIWRIKSLKNK